MYGLQYSAPPKSCSVDAVGGGGLGGSSWSVMQRSFVFLPSSPAVASTNYDRPFVLPLFFFSSLPSG